MRFQYVAFQLTLIFRQTHILTRLSSVSCTIPYLQNSSNVILSCSILVVRKVSWSRPWKRNHSVLLWLVLWNMNGLFFHSVGNVIIPTDFKSIIFQRGRSTQPPSSPEGFLYSSPGFCRNIQRESPLHCTKVPDLERLPLRLGDCGLKPPAGTVQSSGLQSWLCLVCLLDIHLRNGKYL